MCRESQIDSEVQPAIYYLIKGRYYYSTTLMKFIAFEKRFINQNPIEAREQAFSFYSNYATILEAHQDLSWKPLPGEPFIIKNNFSETLVRKYSAVEVKYKDPSQYDKGIAIYMIVQNPIKYRNRVDQIGDRFLIHGIWNFDFEDIQNLKSGLIREFKYYMSFNYNIEGYEEIVDFSIFNFKKNDFQDLRKFSILSTPFNWLVNYYLIENNWYAKLKRNQIKRQNRLKIECIKFKRKETIQTRIQKEDLINNEFLTTLDYDMIVRSIASLFNENGGCIFVGVNKKREIIDVFKSVEFNDFLLGTIKLLQLNHNELIGSTTSSFYKVGDKVVVVFEVLPSSKKGIFLNINDKKVFYRRNDFGFYPLRDAEEILSYWVERKAKLIVIHEILERL
ncbi:Putative DNA-binding domain-containing protein [Flavobacterium micromati]|uniref:Putative DNA-binding domain-containing protein n=1 Tax=Flavobacterium micromati TaxID=229205 RepID=A0A1M5NBV0_9FLAO|nr:RNA-binding domain-containing protein [Flavobacterium micromati]SHG86955.1 Putative DNA-binding domain-containing protein [Flavobacterium micromati]